MTATLGCNSASPIPASASTTSTSRCERTGAAPGAWSALRITAGHRAVKAASTPGSMANPTRFGVGDRCTHRSQGLAGASAASSAAAKGPQVIVGHRARASSAIPSTQGMTDRPRTAPLTRTGTGTPGTREATAWKAPGYQPGVPVEEATEPIARVEALPVSRIRSRAERWYRASQRSSTASGRRAASPIGTSAIARAPAIHHGPARPGRGPGPSGWSLPSSIVDGRARPRRRPRATAAPSTTQVATHTSADHGRPTAPATIAASAITPVPRAGASASESGRDPRRARSAR
jgi:hypothetical protein